MAETKLEIDYQIEGLSQKDAGKDQDIENLKQKPKCRIQKIEIEISYSSDRGPRKRKLQTDDRSNV